MPSDSPTLRPAGVTTAEALPSPGVRVSKARTGTPASNGVPAHSLTAGGRGATQSLFTGTLGALTAHA